MSLSLALDGAVARLVIDRPAKRNAFNNAMWAAVPGLVARAMDDPAVRVLIVAAAVPGVFCAGADIEEFGRGLDDPAAGPGNQGLVRAAQLSLARAPKPVLALVEGDCVGGGCGLAIACDLRVASPAARFGITPARLGIVYSLHDTKLLVDLVGPGQAKRILFTAGLIDAAEALRIGLVEIVAADARAEVEALAATIVANSPHSIAGAKQVIRRIQDGQADDDAATLAMFADAFTGPDFAEGVAAFRAKRRPVF
ncbi:enoyl-CoA hydratase/isomerase family protein [Sphingosinicellaceae bacterium]|nr:enoyl-CoA hydratase/isomerase family protein [Sphingosinicellaceae bacterium]